MVKQVRLAFFFVVIFLGVWLRFWRIGEKSLWLDEVHMLITVKRTLLDGLLQVQDYSAPLYQLMLRTVNHTPFPSEALMRLPAVLFGCLTIAASWWFARTLFGSQVALLAACVIAFNAQMIHYSREARPYSLFTLTSTLSMTFFFHVTREMKRVNIAGYIFFSVLLMYSHFYGFLVFAAQLCYLAVDRFARRRGDGRPLLLLAMAAVCFLSLPAAWLAFRYIVSGAAGVKGGWMPSYGPMSVIGVLGELAYNQPAMGSIFLIPLVASIWPGTDAFELPARKGCAGRIADASSLWQRKSPAVLCTLWIAVSIFPLIVMRYLYRPVFAPRYALPILVPLVSISFAFMRRYNHGIIVLSMAAFIAMSAPAIYGQLKPDNGVRELAGWLNQNAKAEENVYTLDFPSHSTFINPGEMALHYYGYPRRDLKELPLALNDSSTKVDVQGDVFSHDRRSYIVSLFFRGEVEAFLNSMKRTYRVKSYDRSAALFVVEPTGGECR